MRLADQIAFGIVKVHHAGEAAVDTHLVLDRAGLDGIALTRLAVGVGQVLREVAARIHLDTDSLIAASQDPVNLAMLTAEAAADGAIGVPTFIIDEEIFWGQDRIDFVLEKLTELRAAKR
ncbi:DsbA family protein [Porticoccaceae bacterium]|nr:DsbA family protein [Porticoccaceae bacterium]